MDLNQDGRPDLAGTTSGGDLQVALGAGNGTFGPSRSLGQHTRVLASGDINGDGHVDLIVEPLSILPGRGDGTFAAPRVVDVSPGLNNDPESVSRVVVADFNGDGKPDLAAFDTWHVLIYPGRGDYTFDTRLELDSPDGPNSIVALDFNNDGRKDLAASTVLGTVDLFLNHGGLIFTASSLAIAYGMHDVAAADFNGDGRQDLAVAVSLPHNRGYDAGTFYVALGNGDGTFQPPIAHPTGVHGALRIAVGDFNHDGRADVATGNRSTFNIDTSCTGFVYWDSVTIAPGAGNGSFGEAATFRLGTSNRLDQTYQNTLQSLAAADFNNDGWTDLVTAPGTVLLSRASTANHSPSVGAGVDQMVQSGNDIRFDAAASDPDHDWLDFAWRDGSGRSYYAFDDVPGVPLFCAGGAGAGPGTYTVTVSDRRGGTSSDAFVVYPASPSDTRLWLLGPGTLGSETPYTIRWSSQNLSGVASFRVLTSADNGRIWSTVPGCSSLPPDAASCVWSMPGPVTDNALLQVEAYDSTSSRLAFDASDPFRIVAGRSTELSFGWWQADVGSVGATGSATYDVGTFTVKGAGSDIWGTADEFHWTYTLMNGDFDLMARVASVENVNQWTKAGLMLRQYGEPRAIHASLFVTPTTVKGIAFQRRTTFGGTSSSTAGPALAAPVWLRLARAGNVVTAYYRTSSSGSWISIGSETFPALPYDLQVGLAVSSHVHGTLATAVFDNVQVIPPDTHLPPGWSEEDIGAVGPPGSAEATPSAARVTGSGADIWGTADEFHWAFREASGNFSIETLVDSVENVNRWTKAGLMIRADSSPGAQHASLFVTPTTEKGTAFQVRRVAGGPSTQWSSSVAMAPPGWLRLTRQGTIVKAYFRKRQTDEWRNLSEVDLPGLPSTIKVGLAVSSHVDGTLATANFSRLTIEPILTWSTAPIGPGASGSYVDGTAFTLRNRGADVWGTSDAFAYVYTPWTGDGAITARLNFLEFGDAWTKGGLMFRESLASGSRHVFVLASQEKGLAVQYRAATNGVSASAGTFPKHSPGEYGPGFWLLLTREGNTFTGYVSTDTFRWDPIGQAVVAMPPTIYVGLGVTSHNTSIATKGFFDDVTVRRSPFEPTSVPPAP